MWNYITPMHLIGFVIGCAINVAILYLLANRFFGEKGTASVVNCIICALLVFLAGLVAGIAAGIGAGFVMIAIGLFSPVLGGIVAVILGIGIFLYLYLSLGSKWVANSLDLSGGQGSTVLVVYLVLSSISGYIVPRLLGVQEPATSSQHRTVSVGGNYSSYEAEEEEDAEQSELEMEAEPTPAPTDSPTPLPQPAAANSEAAVAAPAATTPIATPAGPVDERLLQPAELLIQQAASEWEQGRKEQAIATMNNALAILTRHLGENHERVKKVELQIEQAKKSL